MKKLLNTSFAYMILGLVFGVFYREYTKFIGFTELTTLSILHTHTLILGMMMFLVVLLLDKQFGISKDPKFNRFYVVYNIGLIATLTLLLVRGLADVGTFTLSKGLDAAISGMAGISHIIMAAGLFRLYGLLRRKIKA